MTKKSAGGPAFPSVNESEGMTLRDYFAAKAMQVFMQNAETDMDEDAADAYRMADLMLKERAK